MLVTVGLFLIAAATEPATASDKNVKPKARACSAVQVSSPEAPKNRRLRFSSRRILDLEFQASVKRGVEGARTMRFRVYTPNGHLYQELIVPVSAGRRKGGRLYMTTRLPVAGTSITNSSLFGRWRVEPHLDGDLAACGATTRFWLKE